MSGVECDLDRPSLVAEAHGVVVARHRAGDRIAQHRDQPRVGDDRAGASRRGRVEQVVGRRLTGDDGDAEHRARRRALASRREEARGSDPVDRPGRCRSSAPPCGARERHAGGRRAARRGSTCRPSARRGSRSPAADGRRRLRMRAATTHRIARAAGLEAQRLRWWSDGHRLRAPTTRARLRSTRRHDPTTARRACSTVCRAQRPNAARQLGVGEHLAQHGGERVGILDRVEHPGVAEHLDVRGDVARDDAAAVAHRLEHRERLTFLERRGEVHRAPA